MGTAVAAEPKKKKKFSFPSAYTILLLVMLIVLVLTYFMPSGKYATISYAGDNQFTIEQPSGKTTKEPATESTLKKYNVNISVDKFKDGSISKPVAIPNTYERLEKEHNGIVGFVKSFLGAPVDGMKDSIDIVIFVLIIGGIVRVVNTMGVFSAGMNSLTKRLKGKEAWLIVIITSLIALGGTTFGMAEETIAFYPILVPVFMMAGYDAMVAIASIYLGSSIGSMISTVNPFATVIASNAAGINFTEGMGLRIVFLIIGVLLCIAYIIRYGNKVRNHPETSLVYDQKEELEENFLGDDLENNAPKFDLHKKITLILFASVFVVMIYGVKELGWYFSEMSMLFLGFALLLAFISGMTEKDYTREFILGAGDLLGTAITIGLARGVTIIMENAEISDTLLYWLSNAVSHMGGILFAIVMLFVFMILGFFIPSSSGLAVLAMPIMAPLADVVGVPRTTIIDAYNWGQGLISFIAPTGLIIASLSMVNVGFNKWIKFVMPLVGMVAVLAMIFLGISVFF